MSINIKPRYLAGFDIVEGVELFQQHHLFGLNKITRPNLT